MPFDVELPGDRMFNQFNGLADRSYDLATQHLRVPVLPSVALALLGAWLLTLPTGNAWLLLATVPLFLALWAIGSLVWYWAWSRGRFRRTCDSIRRFQQHYACSPELMRSLWTLAVDARSQSGRARIFEGVAEESIQRQFAYLRRDPTWETTGTDSHRPA